MEKPKKLFTYFDGKTVEYIEDNQEYLLFLTKDNEKREKQFIKEQRDIRVNELVRKRVGTIAQIKTDNGLVINVLIRGFKESYGNMRWLVTPDSGDRSTECWTEKIIFIN